MKDIEDNRPFYHATPESDDESMRFGDVLSAAIENRWQVLGATLAAFSLGVLYIFLAEPVYEADALLQVEDKKSGIGTLDVNAIFEGDTTINAEIEILQSRLVLGAVVDKLNLEINAGPDYFPIIGAALERRADKNERRAIEVDALEVSASLIGRPLNLVVEPSDGYQLKSEDGDTLLNGKVGEAASASFDGESLLILVSELRAEPGDSFQISKYSRLSSIGKLGNSLSISEKSKGSGILEISLEDTDPESASQKVNAIAEAYVDQNRDRKTKEAESTLKFLDQQLPTVKQEMETAEVALNSYRLDKGSVDLPLETQAILQTIVSVEGQRNNLMQQRDKVTEAFTPVHPVIIALDKQIDRLNVELDELNDQVLELPNTQQEVLRLVRDVAVYTDLYTSLLNTAQELRVIKAGTVGNVRVIDDAVRPLSPIKPRRALVLFASLLLGMFIGIALTFIKRALNAGIEDPEAIENKIKIPVYATILHSNRQDRLYKDLETNAAKRAILAVDSPNDVTIESLKTLKTALHFGMTDAKNNRIMITGPSPAVGKSFISVNLAAILASGDKKVLLIDGDLRRGSLHHYLGLKRNSGLSDFIRGDIALDEALHQTTIEGLTLIPSGTIPPDASVLLEHTRFAECINELAPRFDHVIIDSPPILAVADAGFIGQLADTTVMVLKSGTHPMREIELSVKRLRQVGVNLRGILINDINMRSQRYGAGKYHYQYSYGDKPV